jgi:adenylosuccinate synthase
LQKVGAEIGTTTGRKRRCGWLDLVAVQFSHIINGYTAINLTKLDVLNYLDEIKVGVAYEHYGQLLKYFPG